jgi:hypothetical protein
VGGISLSAKIPYVAGSLPHIEPMDQRVAADPANDMLREGEAPAEPGMAVGPVKPNSSSSRQSGWSDRRLHLFRLPPHLFRQRQHVFRSTSAPDPTGVRIGSVISRNRSDCLRSCPGTRQQVFRLPPHVFRVTSAGAPVCVSTCSGTRLHVFRQASATNPIGSATALSAGREPLT